MECTICTDDVQNPVATPCGHVFCKGCLFQWLARSQMCPVCRKPAQASRCAEISGEAAELLCGSQPRIDQPGFVFGASNGGSRPGDSSDEQASLDVAASDSLLRSIRQNYSAEAKDGSNNTIARDAAGDPTLAPGRSTESGDARLLQRAEQRYSEALCDGAKALQLHCSALDRGVYAPGLGLHLLGARLSALLAHNGRICRLLEVGFFSAAAIAWISWRGLQHVQWCLESIGWSDSGTEGAQSIGAYTAWIVGWLQLGVVAAAALCLAAVLGGTPQQQGSAARWHAGLLVAAAELQPAAGLAVADCIEITSRFARGFAILQRESEPTASRSSQHSRQQQGGQSGSTSGMPGRAPNSKRSALERRGAALRTGASVVAWVQASQAAYALCGGWPLLLTIAGFLAPWSMAGWSREVTPHNAPSLAVYAKNWQSLHRFRKPLQRALRYFAQSQQAQLAAASALTASCVATGSLWPLRLALFAVYSSILCDDTMAMLVEGLRVLAGALGALRRLARTFPELSYGRPGENGLDALRRLLLPQRWHPPRRPVTQPSASQGNARPRAAGLYAYGGVGVLSTGVPGEEGEDKLSRVVGRLIGLKSTSA